MGSSARYCNNATAATISALGVAAGQNLTTGDNNIDIGNPGVANESNAIRIGIEGTQTGDFHRRY